MVIRNNLSGLTATRNLSSTTSKVQKQLQKLNSGYRINKGADDAAGLAISERMRAQIRGLSASSQNAQDGISLIQTAEGALDEIHVMLQRASQLAIQSANGVYSEINRNAIQQEWNDLKSEIDRIAAGTQFNSLNLLSGDLSSKPSMPSGTIMILDDLPFDSIMIYEVQVSHINNTPVTNDTAPQALKTALQQQIVPQAIDALVKTFPNSFDYLKGSNLGIGLTIYSNSRSGALASVTGSRAYYPGMTVDSGEWKIGYNLFVNLHYLTLDGSSDDGLSDASRTELEATIVHEMMHALMFEAHTAPMFDVDNSAHTTNNPTKVDGFPLWFVEGTAQAAGGGSEWVMARDLVLAPGHSKEYIAQQLTATGNRLSDNTSTSHYATGYLATMYLGSLAGGGTDAASVARGVDKILSEIKNGKSMDDAIKDNTNGKYNNTAEFEQAFDTVTKDSEIVSFVDTLMRAYEGTTVDGAGSLVTGNYKEVDLLPNVNKAEDIFYLNQNYQYVFNDYPDNYVIFSGGTQHTAGVAPGIAGSGGGTTPGTGGGGTTPGTGGGGTTPGTGGGTTPSYGGLTFQIGANSDEKLQLSIDAMDTKSLGIRNTDMSTAQGAMEAINQIYSAIDKVSTQRANLGASQNRLEYTINNLNNQTENIQSAESRIRDADMASEMMELVKYQILQQAGQAMFMQANQAPNSVLNLLQ